MFGLEGRGRLCGAGGRLALALMAWAGLASAANLGTELEKAYGDQLARYFLAQYGEIDDPLMADWVREIGEEIAAVAPRRSLRYRFYVIDTSELNAFALPGGHVLVTRGLLSYVSSDDELAGVLAHEIGHLTEKHFQRRLLHHLLAYGLVRGLGAWDETEDLADPAAIWQFFAVMRQWRKHEHQADKSGVDLALRAGYDPEAFARFFETILNGRKSKRSQFETAFSTHPDAWIRLQRVVARVEQRQADDPARLLALANSLASRHRYARALAKFRLAAELDEVSPEPCLWAAQLYRAREQWAEAQEQYRQALQRAPGDSEAQEGLAVAELALREEAERPGESPSALGQLAQRAAAGTRDGLQAGLEELRPATRRASRELKALRARQQANRVLLVGLAIDPKWDVGYIWLALRINGVIFRLNETKALLAEGRERAGTATVRMLELAEEAHQAAQGATGPPVTEAFVAELAGEAGELRAEVAEAGEQLRCGATGLRWAADTLIPVIVDLTGWIDPYDHLPATRFAILQGGIWAAESGVNRAAKRGAVARELATRADLRRLQCRLDREGQKAGEHEDRVLAELAARRVRHEALRVERLRDEGLGLGQSAVALAAATSAGTTSERVLGARATTGGFPEAAETVEADLTSVHAALKLLLQEIEEERETGEEGVEATPAPSSGAELETGIDRAETFLSLVGLGQCLGGAR